MAKTMNSRARVSGLCKSENDLKVEICQSIRQKNKSILQKSRTLRGIQSSRFHRPIRNEELQNTCMVVSSYESKTLTESNNTHIIFPFVRYKSQS